jgi:hypothetical protein
MFLDRAFEKGDFRGALDHLERSRSVTLRIIGNVHRSEEQPIIGSQNEYLRTLCLRIIALEQSLGSKAGKSTQIRDTGSDQSFLCAAEWLARCLTQHTDCIEAEGPLPLLPSRVIDVDGLQDSILRLTPSTRGRYVTLTHRWGSSNITKTTKSNLSQRLASIAFNDLTKTMQDAVTITRMLGVRYLWIDAMCIIQDSHSDWSVEACDMANIYRNALLTIAAASASDHSEGCFTVRDKDEDKYGPGGNLESRGWILQEELLSRRILTYKFGHIKWECISSGASSDSGYSPYTGSLDSGESRVPPETVRFKRVLCGVRSTSMPLQRQAHTGWQHIVESYSGRTLTNESDKLMAIMGIANFIQNILQDSFLLGLWKDHLYHDLLWSTSSATRLTSIKIPSWSWASLSGTVSYHRWPAGSTPSYLKSSFTLVSAKVDPEVSNGNIYGRLVIKGTLHKFETSPWPDRIFPVIEENTVLEPTELAPKKAYPDTPSSKGTDDNKLKPLSSRRIRSKSRRRMPPSNEEESGALLEENDQGRADELGDYSASIPEFERKTPSHLSRKIGDSSIEFLPDRSESFPHVWLLPIASDYYWIHCLVLVHVDLESNDYRRVGLCHVDSDRRSTLLPSAEERIIGLV